MSKFRFWFESTSVYRHVISAFLHPKRFFFLQKYPFWKVRNVITGKFVGYDVSWYECIPEGWRKAFGKQLTEDIASALRQDGIPKRKWAEAVYWSDVKEKYGSLRLYASATKAVDRVLSKYECLSIGYCINCGKPARYITSGWIEYICEDCERATPNEADDRLTTEDIPHYYIYKSGRESEETPLERFNIDFKELWGLDNNG